MSYTTPWSGQLASGTYVVTAPSQIQVSTEVYNFKSWEDGSTNPARTINFTASISIVATYQAKTLTANIISDKTTGDIPVTIIFTVSFSGGIPPYTVTLDYGDGSTVDTITAPGTKSYNYKKVGAWLATLTVTDSLGATAVSKTLSKY